MARFLLKSRRDVLKNKLKVGSGRNPQLLARRGSGQSKSE
jgi:hypothetical protein